MTVRSTYRAQGSLAPLHPEALLERAHDAVKARPGAMALPTRLAARLTALLVRVGLAGMLLMLGGMLVPLFA